MKLTLILPICLVLAGCLGWVAGAGPDSTAFDNGGGRPVPGGWSVAVDSGRARSATGCTLRYRLYRPARPVTDDLVVVGHGFLRSQARMVDLARRLAGEGIPTVTLDYCNTRLWDGRHVRNGLDMIRVADALDARRVVYAGFSAGALAALVAGRSDSRSLGVVALDLVDAARIGEGMAPGFDRPLIGLVGDPSPCNAQNNGLAVFAAAARSRVERVDGAAHCDFESPTDWLCRLICVRDADTRTSPRRHILEAAAEGISSLVGSRPEPTQAVETPADVAG